MAERENKRRRAEERACSASRGRATAVGAAVGRPRDAWVKGSEVAEGRATARMQEMGKETKDKARFKRARVRKIVRMREATSGARVARARWHAVSEAREDGTAA